MGTSGLTLPNTVPHLASDTCGGQQGVALVLAAGQLVPFSALLMNPKKEQQGWVQGVKNIKV